MGRVSDLFILTQEGVFINRERVDYFHISGEYLFAHFTNEKVRVGRIKDKDRAFNILQDIATRSSFTFLYVMPTEE